MQAMLQVLATPPAMLARPLAPAAMRLVRMLVRRLRRAVHLPLGYPRNAGCVLR